MKRLLMMVFAVGFATGLTAYFADEAQAKGVVSGLGDFNSFLGHGLIQGLMAKEVCSCVFVSGQNLDDCKNDAQLPSALFGILHIDVDASRREVRVNALVFPYLNTAVAEFDWRHPHKGCRLTRSADANEPAEQPTH